MPSESPGDRRLYVYRHAQLTVTHLLSRQKRWHDALASADSLIQLATDAGDHLLRQLALLTKTELLQDVGNTREAMETLDIVVDTLAQQPPQLYAQYERILACALAGEGDRHTAAQHFERARRVYEGIRSAPGLVELSRRWNETTTRHGDNGTTGAADLRPRGAERNGGRRATSFRPLPRCSAITAARNWSLARSCSC